MRFNKFKVGDTIMHKNGYRCPYLITDINEYGYELDHYAFRIKYVDDYYKVK